MIARFSRIFSVGTKTDSETPVKSLVHPEYTLDEIARLLEQYPLNSPLHNLLNATYNFLCATDLDYADDRKKNKAINTLFCCKKLNNMGKAIKTANTNLLSPTLSKEVRSDLNVAVQYCAKTVQKRLDELKEKDPKYWDAYEKINNELKSALSPLSYQQRKS